MDVLERYHWPGNVRELRNVIERATIVAKGPFIEPRRSAAAAVATAGRRPGRVGRRRARAGHDRRRGRAAADRHHAAAHDGNKTRAAELLGISLKTLHNKLNRMKDERRTSPRSDAPRHPHQAGRGRHGASWRWPPRSLFAWYVASLTHSPARGQRARRAICCRKPIYQRTFAIVARGGDPAAGASRADEGLRNILESRGLLARDRVRRHRRPRGPRLADADPRGIGRTLERDGQPRRPDRRRGPVAQLRAIYHAGPARSRCGAADDRGRGTSGRSASACRRCCLRGKLLKHLLAPDRGRGRRAGRRRCWSPSSWPGSCCGRFT